MKDLKVSQRLYNVDFLRLLFVTLIVYYHFIPQDFVQNSAIPMLIWMKNNSRSIGFLGNAGLFIVSGFFLAPTLTKNGYTFFQFATHKLMRFWPTLCFAFTCMAIMGMFHLVHHFDVGQNILNLLLIHQNGSGLTTKLSNLNPSWFVCTLFWASLFYYALCNSLKEKNSFIFITALIVWFSTVLYEHSIGIPDYRVVYGFFPRAGMLALGMIGLGILLRAFLSEIRIENRKINYWIASVLEILLFSYLMYGCLIERFKETHMVLIVAFSALFVLFIMHQGFLSQLLNKPWVSKIGRYAFSIYIMQSVGFVCMKYLWAYIRGGGTGSVLLSVLICIFIGVVTYHLIEKPVSDFYRKKIEKVKV